MEIRAGGQHSLATPPGDNSAGNTTTYQGKEITALPQELIEKVFANLEGRDLVVCQRVAKAWHSIINTSPLLACAFYRRYHPLFPEPRLPLPRGIDSSYTETLGWLTRFSQEGSRSAARLEKLLAQGQPRYLTQQLFFTTARVFAQAKVFDDCSACPIRREGMWSVVLSPDQRHLAACCNSIAGISRRINGRWQDIATLPGCHFGSTSGFSPNGEYFIGVDSNGTVKIWETFAEQWRIQTVFFSYPDAFLPYISPNGHSLIRSGVDYTAHISRQVSGQWQTPTPLPDGDITRTAFHPLDDILVTCHRYRTLKIWRFLDHLWQLNTMLQTSFHIIQLSFSPDGHRLFAVSLDGPNMNVYRRADGGWEIEATLQLAKSIYDLNFSPKGDHFVASFQTRTGSPIELEDTVNIWRFFDNRWQEVRLFNVSEFSHACFSPEGDHLLTVARDKQTIFLWGDIAGQWQLQTLLPNLGMVACTCFSPHGYLAIAGDNTVTIWVKSAGQWQKKADLAHDHPVDALSVSPDGQCILASRRYKCSIASIWTLRCKE